MPKFTDTQNTAIGITGRSVLLSAAAGSGKTTTLIERILRSVSRTEDPVKLNRLLIVTFTEAAAGELRARIAAALAKELAAHPDNEELAAQMMLLPGAQISTIDAFYMRLVRSNYAACGISPGFRIADEGEETVLLTEAIEEILEECYDSAASRICGGAEGFARFVGKLVGTKKDDGLGAQLLSLYRSLQNQPLGVKTFRNCADTLRAAADKPFFETEYGRRLAAEAKDVLLYHKAAYQYILPLLECNAKAAEKWLPTFMEEYTGILHAVEALDRGCDAFRAYMADLTYGSLKGKNLSADAFPEKKICKSVRDDYVKFLKDDRFASWFGADAATLRNHFAEAAEVCYGFYELLDALETRVQAEKKRRGLFGFGDISRFAYRLLVDAEGNDTPLALEMKEKYDMVYVDEYQDVNALQDRIFHAVAKENNFFVVGDIKQSIYGFRGASSRVFSELRRTYPNYAEGDGAVASKLFMRENFRCDEEVIQFTNLLFDTLMPLLSPEIGYNAEDALVFSKNDPAPAHPVRVVAVERGDGDKLQAEADWIAAEIDRMMREEAKDNGDPLTYQDFAILLPKIKGVSGAYMDALRRRGIPVQTEAGESLLSQNEIRILHSLLETVDNPRRDIPLCGVLLSPLCGMTPDAITALRGGVRNERLYTTVVRRAEDGEAPELSEFLARLAEMRKQARFLSAGDFLDEVYALFAIPARLGATSAARANLEKFRQIAHRFSAGEARGLHAFLRYMEAAENTRDTFAVAKPKSSGGVVLSTIHRSKGLEYPVVFVACTTAKYNFTHIQNSHFLYDPEAGVGMKLRDATGFGVGSNPIYFSMQVAMKRREKEERLRLLYVALTRARERLYLVGTVKPNKDQTIEDAVHKYQAEANYYTAYSATSKENFFSLTLSVLGDTVRDYCTVEVFPYTARTGDGRITAPEAEEQITADPAAVEALRARLDYSYPHTARTKLPAKLSVSRLYPDILDDAVLTDRIDAERMPKPSEMPRFLSERAAADAAARGTATHLYMQFFDFENAAASGAAAELARLVEKRFITETDAKLVNLSEVEAFLRSPLFTRLLAAKRVYREQRFNLTLPAREFAADGDLQAALADETVLVQGVIDCFFVEENGDVILVDYKTDRLPSDRAEAYRILRERHGCQISYYSRAIERICGTVPKQKLLYSLCLGEAVEISG